MSVMLVDLQNREHTFSVNSYGWRGILEAVRRLDVVDEQTIDGLHEPFTGSGLDAAQAEAVAEAIEERLLPLLDEDDYLLLDGTITRTLPPKESQWMIIARQYRVDVARYYTSAAWLRKFVAYCRSCSGFWVG